MATVRPFVASEAVDWVAADMTRTAFGYADPHVQTELRRFIFRDLLTFAVGVTSAESISLSLVSPTRLRPTVTACGGTTKRCQSQAQRR